MPVPGEKRAQEPAAPWAQRGTAEDPGCRVGHSFTRHHNLMVLTGGMRDRGILQNDIYVPPYPPGRRARASGRAGGAEALRAQVLNLDDGVWSKPACKTTPEDSAAVAASARPCKGMTPAGGPTARTGHTTTGFEHGLVLVGGYDGQYLADVHYLIFRAGVPPPSLPYKVDTSRPSLRTNWTRLVPLTGVGLLVEARRDGATGSTAVVRPGRAVGARGAREGRAKGREALRAGRGPPGCERVHAKRRRGGVLPAQAAGHPPPPPPPNCLKLLHMWSSCGNRRGV